MLLYGIRFQSLEVRWDWLQSCSSGTSTVGAPEARLPPGHLLSVHELDGDWLLVFFGLNHSTGISTSTFNCGNEYSYTA